MYAPYIYYQQPICCVYTGQADLHENVADREEMRMKTFAISAGVVLAVSLLANYNYMGTVLLLFGMYSCIYTVPFNYVCISKNRLTAKSTPKQWGMHLRVPLIHSLQSVHWETSAAGKTVVRGSMLDLRPMKVEMPARSFTTGNGYAITLQIMFAWKIKDIMTAVSKTNNLLGSACDAVLDATRTYVWTTRPQDWIGSTVAGEDSITKAATQISSPLGAEITSVRFYGLDFSTDMQAFVHDHIKIHTQNELAQAQLELDEKLLENKYKIRAREHALATQIETDACISMMDRISTWAKDDTQREVAKQVLQHGCKMRT